MAPLIYVSQIPINAFLRHPFPLNQMNKLDNVKFVIIINVDTVKFRGVR